MNLGLHAQAPSQAPELACTVVVLGHVTANNVELERQPHEALEDSRMPVDWKEYGRGRHLIAEDQEFDHIVAFLKKIIGRSWSVYGDKSEEQTNYCGVV